MNNLKISVRPYWSPMANSLEWKGMKYWTSTTPLDPKDLPEPTEDRTSMPIDLIVPAPYEDKEFFLVMAFYNHEGDHFYTQNMSVRCNSDNTNKVVYYNNWYVGTGEYGRYRYNFREGNKPDTKTFTNAQTFNLVFPSVDTTLCYSGDKQFALANAPLSATATPNDLYFVGYYHHAGFGPDDWSSALMDSFRNGVQPQGRTQTAKDVVWTMRVPTITEFRQLMTNYYGSSYNNGRIFIGGNHTPDGTIWFSTSTPWPGNPTMLTKINLKGETAAQDLDDEAYFYPIIDMRYK